MVDSFMKLRVGTVILKFVQMKQYNWNGEMILFMGTEWLDNYGWEIVRFHYITLYMYQELVEKQG